MRKISIIIAALAFTLTSCEKRLVSDTILDVTPYPLDYELTEGTIYHDKSLPYDSYQWQYAVVPVGYNLASVEIQYEKLC